jgi:hypothetical protein
MPGHRGPYGCWVGGCRGGMVAAAAQQGQVVRFDGSTEHPGDDVSALDVTLSPASPALTVGAVGVGIDDAVAGVPARRWARGMSCCWPSIAIGRSILVIHHGDITLGLPGSRVRECDRLDRYCIFSTSWSVGKRVVKGSTLFGWSSLSEMTRTRRNDGPARRRS